MKKLNVVLVFFCAALLLTFTAAPIAAQGHRHNTPGVKSEAAPARPDIRPQWGTQGSSIKEVHAYTCMPLYSSTLYTYAIMGSGSYQRRCTSGTPGGSCVFECNVDVPSGAQITRIEIDGCDTSATGEISAGLYRDPWGGGEEVWLAAASSGASDTPGCDAFYTDLTTPETIDNYNNSYYVEVYMDNDDTTTTFNAIRIYYQLQISPAPTTASFNDVPVGHPFFQEIEAMYASGITHGCPYPNFCPNNYVTRQEMAAFFARALGLYWPYQ